MSTPSFLDFVAAVVAANVQMRPVKAALDRWLRLVMIGFLIWLVLVFVLAYYGHPALSLVAIFSAWPLLLASYPTLSTAALAVPLFDGTTIGGLLAKILSTINKAVFSAAELAFTLGNDLNDLRTLDFNNPALVAIFFVLWVFGVAQRFSDRPRGAFSVLSLLFAVFLNAVNFPQVLGSLLDHLRSFLPL